MITMKKIIKHIEIIFIVAIIAGFTFFSLVTMVRILAFSLILFLGGLAFNIVFMIKDDPAKKIRLCMLLFILASWWTFVIMISGIYSVQ